MSAFILHPRDKVVVLAPGSSLTHEQVNMIRDSGHYNIAIGDAGRALFPDADVLYHADAAWWYHYRGCPDSTGKKICIEPLNYYDVSRMYVSPSKTEGIDLDYPYLVTGNNSGYQAINLAMYCKPKEIILVGFDMKKRGVSHNVIGDHPKAIKRPADFNLFIENMNSLAQTLDNMNVKVYNCTLDTALKCFEQEELKNVL